MKRPEGFDRTATAPSPSAPVETSDKKTPATKQTKQTGSKRAADASKTGSAEPRKKAAKQSGGASGDAPTPPLKPVRAPKAPKAPKSRKPEDPAKIARREARRAKTDRRRFEKAEVRRFTRRARHRRAVWLTAGGTVAVFGALIATAVFSPLLALERIEVTGTSRLDPAVLVESVDGQLGTPLALVDFDRMTKDLAEFPLIRSYVTEMVPPHTLVIHITERQPVGAIMGEDGYTLVDPAAVVVEKSETRPAGVPLLELVGADVGSSTFDSVVEVMLALPPELLANVDTVTASTMDDVTLVFSGVGQRVVWGSADRSDLKVRVLERLIANQDPAVPVEYDVTAPLSAVVRPL